MTLDRDLIFVLMSLTMLSRTSAAVAQQPARDDQASARAAVFLQSVAESMRIEPDGKRWQLRKTPLLKYSDPARGYLAAGVWRLGETGQPMALISLQYAIPSEGGPRLDYELLPLTDAPFQVKSRGETLSADGTSPQFAPLADAEKPAATGQQRLIQLRRLARRFAVTEKFLDEVAALRLLPQPIDRYDDASLDVVDAAVFVFVYGTNPEAVLFIECDKNGWRYALTRMAWAEVVVTLDGKEVARFEQLTSPPRSGAYRTAGHPIDAKEDR